jgi:hypothetical protein
VKTRTKVLLAVAGLLVLWVAGIGFASSAGEVVQLTTTDASGAAQKTPLWVVDHAGAAWLRAGSAEAGWLARLRANPRVELERGGKSVAYRATPVPEATQAINALMSEKYGAADRLVGLLVPGSRRDSMAVRLDPEAP